MLNSDKNVRHIVKKHLPDTGDTIFDLKWIDVEATDKVQLVGQKWPWRKNQYIFVNLESDECGEVPEPLWSYQDLYAAQFIRVRKEYVIILYSFYGKEGKITLYVHPSMLDSFVEDVTKVH